MMETPEELLLNSYLFLAQDSSTSSTARGRNCVWRSSSPAGSWRSGRSHWRSPWRSSAPARRRRLVPYHLQNSLPRDTTWPARYDRAHAIRAGSLYGTGDFIQSMHNDLHIISNPEKKKARLSVEISFCCLFSAVLMLIVSLGKFFVRENFYFFLIIAF